MFSVLTSVHMSMSTYLHPTPPAEAQIVTLGIKGTNYFLSCYKDGEVPTLRLEVKTYPM